MIALRSIASAAAFLYTRFFLTFFCSLLAGALFVPAIALLSVLSSLLHTALILPAGIALLLGVLPCPAAIGVQTIARDLSLGDLVFFAAQREAFRTYWRVVARIWVVSMAVSIVLIADVAFYVHVAQSHSAFQPVGVVLLALWTVLSLFWLSMHLYVFPLIFEQEDPGVRVVYRNAAILALARPLTTWVVIPVWCIVLLAGSVTGLLAVGGMMIAGGMQQQVTVRILRELRNAVPLERLPREELQ